MPLDLSSVDAKWLRAQEHAQTVKNEVRSWMDTNPYSVTKESNVDFTRYSIVLHVASEPQIERWGLMIGDSIHCLRCVLDHLRPNPAYETQIDLRNVSDSTQKRVERAREEELPAFALCGH